MRTCSRDAIGWFPIPAIQIELSKSNGQNTLTQNPGW